MATETDKTLSLQPLDEADNDPRVYVEACQKVMAHGWMVRTFIKHSEEVEDFPELMGIVRSVFDISRALETRVEEPAGYFKMMSKKIGKLEKATEQFAIDAPEASLHTNFEQAVISMQTCCEQLRYLMERGQAAVKAARARENQAKEQ